MKILSKYIVKTLFSYIFMVAVLWVLIFSFFDFLADGSNIGRGSYTFIDSLYVQLLNAPILMYKRWTVIALIGAILALGHLAATSQLIVARSAGLSIMAIVRTAVGFSLFLFLMIAIIGELVAPSLSEYAKNYKTKLLTGASVQQSTQGFWLKNKDFIVSVAKNYDGKNFEKAQIFQIKNNKLIQVFNAPRMSLTNKQIILDKANFYQIKQEKITFKQEENKKLAVVFDDKLINSLKKSPIDISIIDVYKQVNFLENNNLDSGIFKIELYQRMIKPFILLSTILFAMLFIFGSMRDASIGKKLFLGITISLILELYLRVSGSLVLKFQYNYFVVVLLPLLVFLIFTLRALFAKK